MFLVIAYSDDLVEPKLPRKKLSISIFFDKPVSCVCVCVWMALMKTKDYNQTPFSRMNKPKSPIDEIRPNKVANRIPQE